MKNNNGYKLQIGGRVLKEYIDPNEMDWCETGLNIKAGTQIDDNIGALNIQLASLTWNPIR